MSLLIKALEQAARDRDSAKASSVPALTPAAPESSAEPILEPAPPPRSPRSAEPVSPGRGNGTSDSAAPTARSSVALSLDPPAAQSPASSSTAALAQIDAHEQRARAATVMQASGQSGNVFVTYLRDNPVMMVGALAGLFGVGFGIYVYLQIAQPGLFVRQAEIKPQGNPAQPPAAPTVAHSPASSPADSETAAAPSPGFSTTPATDRGSAANAAMATAGAVPVLPSAGSVGTAPRSSGMAPISAASVIAGVRPAEPARDPALEPEPDVRRERGTQPKPERAKAPAAVPADVASSARERIAVSLTAAQPRVTPSLSQAYTALQSGSIEEARALYSKVRQSEPLNIDALLGLAHIATQENRSDEATKLYVRILQINPRHASAQAALIGSMGRADPLASETRLKQLIAREPSAFLHFVLGNLYADQSLWAQAQHAYFQAHHLEPDNPDYAYNLAVGLDHLRQVKLALGFYQRAEQLAAAQGRSNFNLTHARERISILSSQLE